MTVGDGKARFTRARRKQTISPAEIPTLVQQPFALFDHLAFTPRGDEDENVVVALSPAGAAVFRAWLRQRGLAPLVCSS